MRKLISAACLMALTVLGTAHNANSASVGVDVDINLPGFLILYCYNDIDVTVGAAALTTAMGLTTTNVDVGTSAVAATSAGTGQLAVAIGLDATAAPAPTTAVALELTDICGVRGINNGTGAAPTVGITAGHATTLAAVAPATGSIAVTSAPTTSVTTVPLSGFGTLTTFNVTMPIDLAGVTTAGSFTAAGDEFTVEVLDP